MLDSQRLFDITTRHQLYVERVKIGMFFEFQRTLAEVSRELEILFSRLRFKNLNTLTKSKLSQLIASLRRVQFRIFGTYAERLVRQIEEFMQADLRVIRRMFVSVYEPPGVDEFGITDEEDATEFILAWVSQNRMSPLWGVAAITSDPGKLWASLRNLPLPANGVTLGGFISAFSNSAQGSIENLVRQAWANGLTVSELLENIAGVPGGNLGGLRQGASSQIDRIAQQGDAVIDTVLQFVSGGVSAAVGSSLFQSYMWNSIIDSSTTDICRNRNGKIYDFATGPRPPAHIRCRSHITPIIGPKDVFAAASFASWLASQPQDVQQDFAGAKERKSPPLTTAQFEGKLRNIMAR